MNNREAVSRLRAVNQEGINKSQTSNFLANEYDGLAQQHYSMGGQVSRTPTRKIK